VWRPAVGGSVAHRALAVGGSARYPRFAGRWTALAALADGDVLYASKPRATSYGVALLARRRRPRPLLLDVDDWEVGFFRRGGAWGTLGRALNVGNPNGLPWTWLMERRVRAADAVTVASRFLERRFGGTLITHVRDTEAWDPARYDRVAARAALGLGAERVVMFLGTPRGHKGVDDLVEAVGAVGPGTRLVVVGAGTRGETAGRRAARPRALQLRGRPRRALPARRARPGWERALKLLVVSRPFVFHGGVERATAGFLAALVARGHDVHLLSPRGPRPVAGVTLHTLKAL